MRLSFSSSRPARGFTLIEAALVLTAVSALMAGAFVFSMQGSRSVRAREFVDHFRQLDRVIKSAWPNGNYTGLSNSALLPLISGNRALERGGSLASPNAGAITLVAVSPAGRLPSSRYEVRYSGLDRYSCTQLIEALAAEMEYVRAGSVLVNRVAGDNGYTPQQLTAACASNNTMVQLRPMR